MMQLNKIIKYISYPETNIMIDTIKNYRLTLINLFNMKTTGGYITIRKVYIVALKVHEVLHGCFPNPQTNKIFTAIKF